MLKEILNGNWHIVSARQKLGIRITGFFFCLFEINNKIYIMYNEMNYRLVIQLKTEIVTQ